MFYVYLIVSAVLVPVLNNFFDILKQPYSWWLVPLMILGFFICFVLIHFAWFLILILTSNFSKSADKCTKLFRFLAKPIIPFLISLAGVELDNSGLEKLPETKERMLFVSNHLDNIDPLFLLNAFPDNQIAFIGKKDILTQMPFVAKIMNRLQSLFIDRENDREAAKTIIKAIRLITEDKASIGLFPEGYVSKSGELLPLRNGSLKIALKAKCPIVVCVLHNTPAVFKNIFRRKSYVTFRLVDVIYPETFKDMKTQQLGDLIFKKMHNALEEIKNK